MVKVRLGVVGTLALSLLVLALLCEVAECAAGSDHYKTLGVNRNASAKEIKKAFRDLSKQWHPDKNSSPEAPDRYAEINNAYNVLNDEEKRRIYDQYGEEGLSRQQQSRGTNPFADLFGFGSRGGGGADSMKRGADLGIPLFVDLVDLYNGKEIRVANRKQVLCTQCRGSGARRAEDVKTCTSCGGKGMKITKRQLGPGFVQQMQTTCDVCNGKGSIATSKCPHCKGSKVEIGENELYVLVERGMPDGHKIRFQQAADEMPDTIPGDIVFTVLTNPHPLFTRHGNDLRYAMEISLLDALVGFETTIEHLDGHHVPVKRDTVTIPGAVQRIANEGMPHHEFPSDKGNLYIDYTVSFPRNLTAEEKELARKLLSRE